MATVTEAGLWVDQAAAAAAGVTASSTTAAAQSWSQFTGWYSAAAVAAQAAEMAALTGAAQEAVAGLFTEYVGQITALLRDQRRIEIPRVALPVIRNGVPAATVHARPAYTFKDTFSVTADEEEALRRATERAIRLLEDDLMLAARQAQQDAMDALKVARFRRVLRPELSQSGPCGLCVVAADRIYFVKKPMPLHSRCKCETIPLLDGEDIGQRLNREDLDKLYEAAGGSNAAALKKIRVQVSEHGELGPVLHVRGHKFTGPEDLGEPVDPGRRDRRLAKLNEVLANLRQDPPSEDRDAKIAFQEGAIERTADPGAAGGSSGGSGSDKPPTAAGASDPGDEFDDAEFAGWAVNHPDYRRLTEDEQNQLAYYASSGYREVNRALRGEIPMTPRLQEMADTIRAALRKFPLARATRVSRGTELADLGVTDYGDLESLIGAELTELGFMSTSVLPDPPATIMRLQGIVLDLLLAEGTPAIRITDPLADPDSAHERELLVIDGRRLLIVGVSFDQRLGKFRVRALVLKETT